MDILILDITGYPLINGYPNKYTQGLRYYPFLVNLDRCTGRYKTLNDRSNSIFAPNKQNT